MCSPKKNIGENHKTHHIIKAYKTLYDMHRINNYLRIIFLAYKAEIHTVLRNSGALLILVGAAIIYPVIYSFTYGPEMLRELPIAMVDIDNTATSRTLVNMIEATEQVDISEKVISLDEAQKLFAQKKVQGIIMIPAGFESSIIKGEQTSISSYCDASYFLKYKQTLTAVIQSSLTFSAGVEVKRHLVKGSSMEQAIHQVQPITMKFNDLYNPSSGYASFVMPALIIFILQQTLLIGIGLMGGSQRERGRHIHTLRGFDQYPTAIIFGKTLAYGLISSFNAIIALGWVHYWFEFPMNTNILSLLVVLVPFILSTIFMGIAISAVFKKAENSIMILVFLSLIIVFMTGFSWPVSSLPVPLQYLRLIFPCNIIIQPYLRVREMGASLQDVSSEMIMIYGQMLAYFLLTLFIFKNKRSRNNTSVNN